MSRHGRGGYGPGGSVYYAPSRGLAIGQGIASGVQQGIQNFQNVRMRQMQMQALQWQRQAQLQQAQAHADYYKMMGQRYAPADASKVQLALEAYNHPGIPKDISGPLLKQQVKQAFDNADTSQAVQSLRSQLSDVVGKASPGTARAMTEAQPGFVGPGSPDSMLQGQPAMQSAPPLNYQENQDFQKGLQQQGQLQRTGMQEQGRNNRNSATNSTNLQRSNIQAGATVTAAQVRGSDAATIRNQGRPDPMAAKAIAALWDEHKGVTKQIGDADKGTGLMGLPPDPATVSQRRAVLQDRANSILDQIHQLSNPGQAAPSAAPQAAPAPITAPRPDAKTIQWTPGTKVTGRPGDLLQGPNGQTHLIVNDQGQIAPTPYSAPAPQPNPAPSDDTPPPPPPGLSGE